MGELISGDIRMSVRNSLEKLLPFKTGEFHVTDSADFISTLCPNELVAFEVWIDLFERCGGFKHRNFEAFYLYGFFMDGKTPIEAVEINKPFDIAQHEWSDGDVALHHCGPEELVLNVNFRCAVLCKQDATAIAKALGVTAEDLK